VGVYTAAFTQLLFIDLVNMVILSFAQQPENSILGLNGAQYSMTIFHVNGLSALSIAGGLFNMAGGYNPRC
jgi:hypothetical protein